MLWIPASFNLGGRELSHCTKGCCHPEMSHCHWSSSSPLRYSCLCWCSGLGHPANPACPAHTGCVSCSQKNCPSREAQVRTVVRTAQGGEDRADLGACCGSLERERQKGRIWGLTSVKVSVSAVKVRLQLPLEQGAHSAQAAPTAGLCSPISNVTPGAVPSWPCQCQPHLFPMWWEEITDSKPLSLKITGRCHRRVNASHSKNKILSLELKDGIMHRTEF